MLYRRVKAINVLSHVETEINFKGMDAVVVVGPNGAGKSSLVIDVPLVAAFGQGRSSDLDGYVRNGANWAQFEFDFSTDQGIFRVVRKRSVKTSRGTSVLEFYQIDDQGEVIKPLTAGTIGETESLIKRTLGMEFDTLVRSSIIEQGEADFFCKASPSERMDLFSKVWDLEKYDDWSGMARDVWKEASERIKVIDERAEANSIAIREIPHRKEELEKLQKQMGRQSTVVLDIEKKKGGLQKKMGVFDGLTKELANANGLQSKIEADLKGVSEQHSAVLAKIDRFSKILKNQDVVVQKVAEEKEKEQQLKNWDGVRAKLDAELDVYRGEIDSLRKEYQGKLDAVGMEIVEIDKQTTEQMSARTALGKEGAQLERRKEQLKQMSVDADKLKGVQCHPDFDPGYVNESCRFIKDAVIAKKGIPGFEESLKTDAEALKARESEVELKIHVLTEKKADRSRAIGKYREELISVSETHEKKTAGLKADLRKVDDDIESVKADLADLKRYTKLLPEISLADAELPGLKNDERTLFKRATDLAADAEKQKKEKARIAEQMAGKKDVEKELQSVCNELDKETATKEDLAKKVGAVETAITMAEAMRDQVKADEKEIEDLSGKKALYQMLEDAFKQIPFMLVSRGIGAVESLANEILGIISSAGLQVRIETERMTKTTKKMRDEIHLVFEDRDGRKEYKFLSGGEKLRAALSLRLAISEVFAHRRGVRVDSLLADEPFGPLDTEGIEDMKDAMRELRKRFKFIGVITHIERAQDIFPTRLIFERGPNGTSVTVGEEYA